MIAKAAAKQTLLVSRWYQDANGNKSNSSVLDSSDVANLDASEAVRTWLSYVPANSPALLVLVDGARYLVNDSSRELVRKLLDDHPTLYLLVTFEKLGDVDNATVL